MSLFVRHEGILAPDDIDIVADFHGARGDSTGDVRHIYTWSDDWPGRGGSPPRPLSCLANRYAVGTRSRADE